MWAIVRDVSERKRTEEALRGASSRPTLRLRAGDARGRHRARGEQPALRHAHDAQDGDRGARAVGARPGCRWPRAARSNLASVQELLGRVREEAEHIAHIVRELNVIGRQAGPAPASALAAALARAMFWLGSSVEERISVASRSAQAGEVIASEGQVAQVLVNLVQNAVRAIPKSGRRRRGPRRRGSRGWRASRWRTTGRA
jgi:signal transduction histidine kinase